MSQFGNSIATATIYTDSVEIVTDVTNDVSVFKVTLANNGFVQFVSQFISRPNWDGTSDVNYYIYDASGATLLAVHDTANDVTGVAQHLLAGDYYVSIVVDNAIDSHVQFTIDHQALYLEVDPHPPIDLPLSEYVNIYPAPARTIELHDFNRVSMFAHLPAPYSATLSDRYNGSGVIQGTLKVADVLSPRWVGLYDRRSKQLITSTVSDVNGDYVFTGVATPIENPNAEYFVLGLDWDKFYNADVSDLIEAI